MAHVKLTSKRYVLLGVGSIVDLLFGAVGVKTVNFREYFCNGAASLCPFAEHVFRSRLRIEVHAGHAGTLLSAVVLFLHHEVELIQPVHPRTILLLVKLQGFEQAYHGHATFMLQLFHLSEDIDDERRQGDKHTHARES